MNVSAASQTAADLALAVYLEPHAEGRRVLVLSGIEAPLSRHLEALAEHLDVIDPGPREEGNGEVPELPFDDESFDLIVVSDASSLPEPRRDAVRELRRTLARDGLLAIALRTDAKRGDGDALERLTAREFASVNVLSQTPTLGYTLRDNQAGRAELAIDGSLLRDNPERSERVVVLASDAQPAFEPRLWVQVPSQHMLGERAEEVDPRWVESLRKAEDEARQALGREGELLRELAREKKAREQAESGKERTKALERKLLAIEADYDDAVARVRYFEGLLLEREAEEEGERNAGGASARSSTRSPSRAGARTDQREAEREIARLREELSTLDDRLRASEAEHERAQAGSESVASESAEYERRVSELGAELSAALREQKRSEHISRDLLEELRGLEQRALVTVEHDARVAELEAERGRAMQRALEAELARESAQMRVDELRAQIEAPVGREPSAELEAERDRLVQELDALRRHHADEAEAQRQLEADQAAQVSALRGERTGLRFRLEEAEGALRSLESTIRSADRALDTRLSLAEARADAAIAALGEAEASLKSLRSDVDRAQQERAQLERAQQDRAEPAPPPAAVDDAHKSELEAQLARAEKRIEALERELEEADRFAEENADDLNRLDSLESELDQTRQKLDQVDDEVRVLQDELFAKKELLRERDAQLAGAEEQANQARSEATRVYGEAQVRSEQLVRREGELLAERDDAHAALAEARAILSHLAARVGADSHDLPGIMQALDQHAAPPSTLDALRKALAEAQAARSDAEYQLSRISMQLEERETRIRQLEENGRPELISHSNFDPPEV